MQSPKYFCLMMRLIKYCFFVLIMFVCIYVYGIYVAQILNTELAEKEHITKVQPADVSCIRSSSILYHKPCVQEHQVPNLDYSPHGKCGLTLDL